ncbi:PAS domain S-box protein [Chondromyces crocatus]|nr:PAS domain S-box protein [Chondromyces crocatus]
MDKADPEQDTRAQLARLHAENTALKARLREYEEHFGEPADTFDTKAFLTSRPAEIQWSPEGLLIDWSPEAEQLFGWKREEVLGRPLWEIVIPPGVALEQVRLGIQVTLTGQLASARSSNTTRDGQLIECQWTNTIARDEQGVPHAVLSRIELVEQDELDATLRHSQTFLIALLNNSPSVIFVKDTRGRYVMINQRFLDILGATHEEILGRTDSELFPPDVAAALQNVDTAALTAGEPVQYEEVIPTTEGLRDFFTLKFPVRAPSGKTLGICGITTDVSDRKRAEADRLALQEQIIEAQRDALRELSTPLMPIIDGVLAMPLVGAIDGIRAKEILETLLAGIVREHAHTAILDITGVKIVDTQVANALVGVARAARLLGAKVLLTGISPAVAQTLAALSLDLHDLVTLNTLQSGIAYALRLKREGASPVRRPR